MRISVRYGRFDCGRRRFLFGGLSLTGMFVGSGIRGFAALEGDADPRGKVFGFVRNVRPAEPPEKRTSGVLALDVADGTVTVTEVLVPNVFRVAPDAERLAFKTPGGEIETVSLREGRSSAKRVCTLGGASIIDPVVWSADGTRLIASCGEQEGGRWNFVTHLITIANAKVQNLNVPKTDEVWDWSRDGRLLATLSKPIDRSGLEAAVVAIDGSIARRVIASAVQPPVRFAPDGKSIAYIRSDGTRVGIWVSAIDGGGEPRQVASTRGDCVFGGLSWSPSGRWIAFTQMAKPEIARKPGTRKAQSLTDCVWLASVDGRDTRRVGLGEFKIYGMIDWR